MLEKPVVERPVIFEFQGANRMRDPFYGIRLAVGKVIGRINAPLIARAMMCRLEDTVHYRIAQVEVRRCHIDFRPERSRPIGEFPRFHAFEQIEILLDRSFPVGAILTRLGQSPPVFTDLVSGQITNIGLPRLNQLNRKLIERREIIRSVILSTTPIETQPTHVFFYRFDIFNVFFARIGIVES